MIQFTWNEAKRLENIVKHGLDFIDVVAVFDGVTTSVEDERDYEDGPRYLTLGILHGVVIVVVHTFVLPNTIRIISARKATRYERDSFFRSWK